jgi:hypothetical protein
VKGILADNNISGHFRVLLGLFAAEPRRELWQHLALGVPTFQDLGLATSDSDKVVWLCCQRNEIVLITANPNDEDEDSLENTIRTLNRADCLPVLTLADADRVLQDKLYAGEAADRILEILFDIENYLGTGRVYVP